jgi:hypothetical protein
VIHYSEVDCDSSDKAFSRYYVSNGDDPLRVSWLMIEFSADIVFAGVPGSSLPNGSFSL